MARIPTCFLLLPKRVSSGESGSLVSASPLIKGESQEYSRTLFRKLCSRCEQYWLPSHSSGSFNMRIINYQVSSHTGYVSSSKHFSSHTACNTLNSYCVLPPLSFFFYVHHFKNLYWIYSSIPSFLCFGFGLWGMWDLSLLTRDWTSVPGIGGQSLNQWAIREAHSSTVLTMTHTDTYTLALSLIYSKNLEVSHCLESFSVF